MKIKELPKKSFHPSKSLGQNFLIDKNILKKICKLGELKKSDFVIEIGPGKGALTKLIAPNVKNITAIEKDKRLIKYLREDLAEFKNIDLINEDVLKLDFKDYYRNGKLKLISNLPYNISAPILLKIYENRKIFEKIVITVQKEVGDKICSKHGSKDYGSLSILMQNYFDVKMNFKIPPSAFYPKPKVDSVVLTMVPLGKPKYEVKDEKMFELVIRQAFSTRRKILRNSLSNHFEKELIDKVLTESEIDYKRRAETLEISEFVDLANKFYELQQLTSSMSNLF